ncbi:putative P-loop containing nucleoside triphosphate hydrolase superfamily protein [Agrobacterium phage OLIVR4]|nr:putative P-loop containing nucleoside triphosphate hydrolase superfamily protein [Agrobacterium phage OLIVR4]
MRQEIKNWLNNVRLGHFNERALVVVGGKSSGKTTFSVMAAKALGLKEDHRIVIDIESVRSKFFIDSVRQFSMVVIEAEPDNVDEVLERLKPIMSNRQIHVDRFGKSSITVNNRMNFMILTEKYEPPAASRRVIVASPIYAMNVLTEI